MSDIFLLESLRKIINNIREYRYHFLNSFIDSRQERRSFDHWGLQNGLLIEEGAWICFLYMSIHIVKIASNFYRLYSMKRIRSVEPIRDRITAYFG